MKDATALCAIPTRTIVAGTLVPVLAFAFGIGTGGTATLDYVRERGNRGYPFVTYDPAKMVTDAVASRTPAENLWRIRDVFKPAVTTLADALGVSRQAIYDWMAEKPVASENASRLEDLARAADIFAVEALVETPRLLRRAITNGKSFFQLVKEGAPAESTARTLIEIFHSESHQREALKARFAGRRLPAREKFEGLGTPMLDERG
jgi:hypothetical protein